MQKKIYETKNADKNKDLVNVIKSGLADLENEIEEMSEKEKEIEIPYEIEDIVERILCLNCQNQNKKGQGLKILTLDQMLNRLPISLAQLKAGNNSGELKNEIGQLRYYFYCSKKLTKTIYKHLVSII